MNLAAILGGGAVDALDKLIGRFVASPDDKARASRELAEILQRPAMAQIEVNKIEAGHASVFVAGWRPMIGWTCAAALAYHFMVHDLLSWVAALAIPGAPPLPGVNSDDLFELVIAMLGLAGFRTYEKTKVP